MGRVNLTLPTALVLRALRAGWHYGFDVIDATGLASGTVYPILRRLDREGFVRSRWEDARVAQREQRPTRRYYEITADGERILADAQARYPALATLLAPAPRGARSAKARG